MKNKFCLLLLLVSALALSNGRADTAVYNQPASNPQSDNYYTWGSFNTPDGVSVPTYDNFTLATTNSVTAVQWTGNYIDTVTDGNNPASPDTPTFRITFYSDANGQPGDALATSTLSLADCHPVLLSTVDFPNPTDGVTFQIPLYSYSAELPNAFTATAGQQYWISIVGECTGDEPIWSWYSGDGGDGQCIQVYEGQQVRPSDCAFTLQGTPTSEPTLPSTFFAGETALSNGVYYLAFPDGDYFGYYSFLSDTHYIYHFDLGYEYCFDAADGENGVYLYDFASSHFFYTSPTFPFPYLYDFSLNAVLYYYPDPTQPGHYNTEGIRYFYDFATGKIIAE